jgi:hypothetical protein
MRPLEGLVIAHRIEMLPTSSRWASCRPVLFLSLRARPERRAAAVWPGQSSSDQALAPHARHAADRTNECHPRCVSVFWMWLAVAGFAYTLPMRVHRRAAESGELRASSSAR